MSGFCRFQWKFISKVNKHREQLMSDYMYLLFSSFDFFYYSFFSSVFFFRTFCSFPMLLEIFSLFICRFRSTVSISNYIYTSTGPPQWWSRAWEWKGERKIKLYLPFSDQFTWHQHHHQHRWEQNHWENIIFSFKSTLLVLSFVYFDPASKFEERYTSKSLKPK